MTVFDTALAVLHADVNMSVAADYRRGGQGAAAALRITREVVDAAFAAFAQPVTGRADVVRVRVADAATVGKNDTLEVYDSAGAAVVERLVVTEAHLDAEGITWMAHVRRM